MAIPSGSGTEVLKRGFAEQCTADGYTYFNWDGSTESSATEVAVPANHIITLLSFTMCDLDNAVNTFTLQYYFASTALGILQGQSVGAYQTFVWNEKMVLTAGDKLRIHTPAGANFDLYFSFIDQDWS
jgi:hypothetical protein